MSRRQKTNDRSTMLDLWRPPRGAGDPIGCLATTYTFHPGLFDEQCLGRFFGIESEPRRESLAFLLEREMRLGSAYAGVLVDAAAAGVPHSLRWDILPVRIPGGRQHAKVSLLAWQDHVRLIVASANLTRPGYRSNFEVAAPIDFSAADCDGRLLADGLAFLRSLLDLVPGGSDLVETKRAGDFLGKVAALTADWKAPARGGLVRHRLACTLPGRGAAARGAFDEFIAACRSRGTLPYRMWIASPFFDDEAVPSRAAEAVCRQMARGAVREVWLCAPGAAGGGKGTTLIHAPRAVYDTFMNAGTKIHVELVPDADDGESRKWHAKMVHAFADSYVALMVGSSNFTAAGLGLGSTRNAEANLVTLVDHQDHAREEGLLRAVWNGMEPVADPERASWQQLPEDDEEDAAGMPVPTGFVAATFHAADPRRIVLRLVPDGLPDSWTVRAVGGIADGEPMIGSADWTRDGERPAVEVPWPALEPPERLRIDWDEHHAFMPLNVADALALPVPSEVRDMTADEMLAIIASADPGAAIRAWGGRHQPADPLVDADLDSADPVDLDPLFRYRLADTFLHRVRRRARVMADLRRFVERPVTSDQSLEWRLRGFVGIEPLARKFATEFEAAEARGADPREALLTLADLLVVLRDARYEPAEGSLPAARFKKRYDVFLDRLARQLDEQVRDRLEGMAGDVATFWQNVVERCLR